MILSTDNDRTGTMVYPRHPRASTIIKHIFMIITHPSKPPVAKASNGSQPAMPTATDPTVVGVGDDVEANEAYQYQVWSPAR